MGVSINGPIFWMVYFMENPIKMDDLGATPMDWKPPYAHGKMQQAGSSWRQRVTLGKSPGR